MVDSRQRLIADMDEIVQVDIDRKLRAINLLNDQSERQRMFQNIHS